MNFSERLDYAMKEAGLTQGALAKAVGMAQSSVWKLVSGQAKGSRKAVDIAKVLGVNPEWLTNGTGEMLSEKKDKATGNGPVGLDAYNGMFPVNIYHKEQPTGDKILVPNSVKSGACKAYHITANTGCAMVPAGTYIVVDSGESAGDGDLVYASIDGSLSVYKFVQGGKRGYLSVDDPRVPLLEVAEGVDVLGVIVFLLRNMKNR